MNVAVDLLARQALLASVVGQDFIQGHFPFKLLWVSMVSKWLTGSPRKVFEA